MICRVIWVWQRIAWVAGTDTWVPGDCEKSVYGEIFEMYRLD